MDNTIFAQVRSHSWFPSSSRHACSLSVCVCVYTPLWTNIALESSACQRSCMGDIWPPWVTKRSDWLHVTGKLATTAKNGYKYHRPFLNNTPTTWLAIKGYLWRLIGIFTQKHDSRLWPKKPQFYTRTSLDYTLRHKTQDDQKNQFYGRTSLDYTLSKNYIRLKMIKTVLQ